MSARSGGLLELVARGKKDLFFTANPQVSHVHSVYLRAAPFTKEIYIAKSRNVPEWGKWVDFDIEHRGDLIKQFYLRITLPTWLPADVYEINKRGLVTDASGVTFGYTNNVGFLMIDKVQFFQDQLLVHEVYGEYLDWRLRQSYDVGHTAMIADQVGSREETALAIGRSASQTSLRVPLPLLGWQHIHDPGLPLTALRSERYRIRVHLRALTDVLVASDGRLQPSPWDMSLRVQATAGGSITRHMSLPRLAMERLDMSLEMTQVYVAPDVQTYLRAAVLRFPFLHVQHYQYTIDDPQMTAAAFTGAGTGFTMPIDFIGPTDRLLLGFRSLACTLAGQRATLRASNGAPFIRNLRLNIANIDRIKQFPVAYFREVTAYWKHARLGRDMEQPHLPQEMYTITFGGYDVGVPAGTLNFSRATTPNLYVTLNSIPYDPRNISRETHALLYSESWNVYEVRNGRGRLVFDES
jgi:hypothetical protein